MKLQAINNNLTIQNSKSNKIAKKAYLKNNATNAILNNSLNEAIGRSQVSFKGTGKAVKGGFYYQNENLIGKSAEEIRFNDRNGSLEFKAQNSQGDIVQHMYFIPSKGTRVLINVDGDGNKTEQRIMPHGTLTKITDSQDRKLLVKKDDRKGTIDTLEFDYEMGRQILVQQRPNQKINTIRVFTLEGKEIFEGELLKERVEIEDNYFETSNIISGKLYKTEKYSNKGKDAEIVEYWDDNDNIKKEITIKKGTKTVIFRNENGLKTKGVTIERNGDRTFEEYAQDGITKISKVRNCYDLDGKISKRTEYDPATNAILNVKTFDRDNNSYTEYIYNTSPNVAMASKTYVCGELREECDYYITQKDKKDIRRKSTYITPHERLDEFYNNASRKKLTYAVWYEDNVAQKVENYDEKTGILYERREKHPGMKGWFIVSNFDDVDGKATLHVKRVMSNRTTVAKNIYYHADGKHVRKVQDFAPDRSFKLTCYDLNGKKTQEAIYNPDKTLRQRII